MARAPGKAKATAATAAVVRMSNKSSGSKVGAQSKKSRHWSEWFSKAACVTAHWMGKPVAFLTAATCVIVWAATGPLFGYSDTWQLVINTSTTIVTFLMVFLIQNTQNRDTMALQLKLSELILVIGEAENRFATAEDLSDEELEQLHEELKQRTEMALGTLDSRRSASEKKAS
jgi:low affinity Fe/Cu permease